MEAQVLNDSLSSLFKGIFQIIGQLTTGTDMREALVFSSIC